MALYIHPTDQEKEGAVNDIRVLFVLYTNAEIKTRDVSINLGRRNAHLRIRPCGNAAGATQDIPRVSVVTETAVGLPRNHQHNGNTINVQPVRGTNRHVITITGTDFMSLPRASRLEDAEGDAELGTAITGMLRSVLPNHRFV